MLEYLLVTFIVIFCIQFIFYIIVFGFFAFSKKQSKLKSNSPPVSVLICAKNEALNLIKNIPYILKQNYPNFELILINDSSKDHTLKVMEQFKKESSVQIKVVDVKANEQFWGSKKYALTLGIKASSYEHLLLTDADCKPNSENWISEMTQHFDTEHQIILGYGAYKKMNKSFLNKLIRFETLLTAIQYFSFSKIGIPYMGVGRNLAYTKSLFFSTNGFVNHMKIKSGDDDLFVNQVATKQNITTCYSTDSFTESIPKSTFKTWIHQKRRHISTASFYKPHHKFLLGLFYTSQLLFWVLAIILLSFLYQWPIIVAIIVIRILFYYITINSSAKKLNEKDLVLLAPLFEVFLIFIQLFIFIKNLISKPKNW